VAQWGAGQLVVHHAMLCLLCCLLLAVQLISRGVLFSGLQLLLP